MGDTATSKKKFGWKKILIGSWNWKRPIRLVALIYVSLLIMALFFSDMILFPAPQSSYNEKTKNLSYFKSKDDTTLAFRTWKTPFKEKGIILYFHGNAVDIGLLDPLALTMNTEGYSFIAMDYRGYGLSEGKPKEQHCYDDAENFIKHLAEIGFKTENLILWGRSLGGGIASEMAHRHTFKGLVLESTFCTAFRAATVYPIMPFDKFHNLNKIQKIYEPTFFLHGENDKVIAAWHTEKLQKSHPGMNKRIVVSGVGHNDLWNGDRSEVLEEFNKFFAE